MNTSLTSSKTFGFQCSTVDDTVPIFAFQATRLKYMRLENTRYVHIFPSFTFPIFNDFYSTILELIKSAFSPPLYALIGLTSSVVLSNYDYSLSIKSMSPRCANFSHSHMKHIIGPRFNISKNHLIDRILLRNIPDILKDNSVLRTVRVVASHLMPASFFFLLKGMCLLSSIGKQRYVNNFALMAGDLRRQLPLESRIQIYILNAPVQLSRFPRSIVLGHLVREHILIALFLNR